MWWVFDSHPIKAAQKVLIWLYGELDRLLVRTREKKYVRVEKIDWTVPNRTKSDRLHTISVYSEIDEVGLSQIAPRKIKESRWKKCSAKREWSPHLVLPPADSRRPIPMNIYGVELLQIDEPKRSIPNNSPCFVFFSSFIERVESNYLTSSVATDFDSAIVHRYNFQVYPSVQVCPSYLKFATAINQTAQINNVQEISRGVKKKRGI